MDRRVNPTPAQILAEVDRLISRRHAQRAGLQKLRPLLISQLMLFAKIGRRETDRAPDALKQQGRGGVSRAAASRVTARTPPASVTRPEGTNGVE